MTRASDRPNEISIRRLFVYLSRSSPVAIFDLYSCLSMQQKADVGICFFPLDSFTFFASLKVNTLWHRLCDREGRFFNGQPVHPSRYLQIFHSNYLVTITLLQQGLDNGFSQCIRKFAIIRQMIEKNRPKKGEIVVKECLKSSPINPFGLAAFVILRRMDSLHFFLIGLINLRPSSLYLHVSHPRLTCLNQ